MMYKSSLGLTLLLISAAGATAAELSLGGGIAYNESIYKGYNQNNHFAPLVHYESASVYFRQTTLGLVVARDPRNELSLTASWLPWAFSPGNNDDAAMKQLDKRNTTAMAGAAWYHHQRWGSLKLAAAADVLDNSNGWTAEATLFRVLPMGRLTLTPSVGISYFDDKFNQYYYGISPAESRRSGLATYSAKGGWNPFVGVSAKYALTGNLALNLGAIYTVLPDALKDSPMVDRRDSTALLAGVTWRF